MKKILNTFQKWMTAITFAEAGLYEDAVRMAEGLSYQAPATDGFLQSLGLGGVRVTYGVFVVGSAR